MSEKLKFRRSGSIPPGGYRYAVGETMIRGNTMDEVYRNVLKYCAANALAPPSYEDVEDWYCRQIPSEWCRGGNIVRRVIQGAKSMLNKVMQATGTMVSWYIDSRCQPVEQSVIARRVAICSQCEYHQNLAGCRGCGAARALKGIYERHFNQVYVPGDENLKECAICECELKVKTRIPIEILLNRMPAEQIGKLPASCWLKME